MLTTLQCNFACDYCIQGDHGDYNKHAAKMSMETAARTAEWAERRLDTVRPASFALTFFGGEPLLNLPVVYLPVGTAVGELHGARRADADQHHHQRPAADAGRGGPARAARAERRQGHARRRPRHPQPDAPAPRRPGHVRPDRPATSGRSPASAGSRSAATSTRARSTAIPALLDFLREQEFADKLSKVAFKPVIKPPQPAQPKGLISADRPERRRQAAQRRLHDVGRHGRLQRLRQLQFPRREDDLPPRGDDAPRLPDDGRRAHGTVRDPQAQRPHDRPGRLALRLPRVRGRGHAVDRPHRRPDEQWRRAAAKRFEVITAWKECNDCAFIPVCAGGCSVAAHTELLDMKKPNCHKTSFEAGLVTLAHKAAQAAEPALVG